MKTIDEIRKTRNLFIEAETDNAGMGGYYYDVISGKNLNFIFSYQMGWEHLSVSMPSKTPSWDQMCRMKDIFWNKDEEEKEMFLKACEIYGVGINKWKYNKREK